MSDAITTLISSQEGGAALAIAIRSTFDRMAIAEEEIASAKRRFPREAEQVHRAFKILCPPPGLRGLSDEVFRAHARELVERVALGRGYAARHARRDDGGTRASEFPCSPRRDRVRGLRAPFRGDVPLPGEGAFRRIRESDRGLPRGSRGAARRIGQEGRGPGKADSPRAGDESRSWAHQSAAPGS